MIAPTMTACIRLSSIIQLKTKATIEGIVIIMARIEPFRIISGIVNLLIFSFTNVQNSENGYKNQILAMNAYADITNTILVKTNSILILYIIT